MPVYVLSGHAIFRLEECDRCKALTGLSQNPAQVYLNVIRSNDVTETNLGGRTIVIYQ